MRGSRPGGAFRLAQAGVARRATLGHVARLVACSPAGAGVLVEGVLDGSPLWVHPSTRALAAVLATVGRAGDPGWRWGPVPRSPDPGGGGRGTWWGELLDPPRPDRAEDGGAPEETPVRPPPPDPQRRFPHPLPDGFWLGVQSHWLHRGGGELVAPTRHRLVAPDTARDRAPALALLALQGALGWGARVRWRTDGFLARRRWETGRLAARVGRAARPLTADRAVDRVEPVTAPPFPTARERARHMVVVGASGTGKTTFLARLAARRVEAGESVVVLDLHGDLAPRVADLLGPAHQARVTALDPSEGEDAGPGLPLLGAGGDPDRDVAPVVSALKRLSPDGRDLYWGFRLERVLETFVRAVAEEGGTLLDLFGLLTDPDRREATRRATRQPAVEQFLGEIPGLLKRAPEFLGPATARLAPLALSPRLTALLAPPWDRSIDLAQELAGDRSLLVRLALPALGPDLVAYAGTLVLARVYLDLARRPVPRPVLLVLDEAQLLSGPLVAEILSEGRKFGVEAVVATQFPDRFAPVLRAAASGAVGAHVAFRVPAAATASMAEWTGLPGGETGQILPRLPDGWAVIAPTADWPTHRLLHEPPPPDPVDPRPWEAMVEATRGRFPPPPTPGDGVDADEEILLALYGAGAPVAPADLVGPGGVGSAREPAVVLDRLPALERRGLVVRGPGGVSLTAAGALQLGAGAEHGSSSEGVEHRQLLLEAFRVFALHGERLRLVRQGRFDTQLPDALLRLLPRDVDRLGGEGLVRILERRRASWAWRCFGGRDVHVEAEVSGAARAERIRRGYQKARRAGAFALFLVGDPVRARRLRALLARLGAGPLTATVWTLPRAQGRHPLRGGDPRGTPCGSSSPWASLSPGSGRAGAAPTPRPISRSPSSATSPTTGSPS